MGCLDHADNDIYNNLGLISKIKIPYISQQFMVATVLYNLTYNNIYILGLFMLACF